MTGGYDAEGDSELLNRYLEYVRDPPTSGNIAHYKAGQRKLWAYQTPILYPFGMVPTP